jgi:DNA replication and repair protein RecF
MRVLQLALRYFRNYDRLDVTLSPHSTILFGENAQGKSNLLEAIYYLATTRSFRAGSDRELLSWRLADDPIGFTRVAGRADRGGEAFELEIILREEPRAEETDGNATTLSKRIKLNEAPKRALDIVGAVMAVMFSPQDLDLVDGAPLLRRRYLDVTISQADRRYCRSLAHYNRVILQRNHLLRAIRDRAAKPDQLHFWDREMIAAGSYVVAQRLETIRRLGEVAQRFYLDLGGGDEALGIAYKSSAHGAVVETTPSVEEITVAFEARQAELQSREILLGVSLVGPHRDDVVLQLGGHDLGAFGSRGQQRSVALALKLAEAEHLFRQTGELPILLLDDVLSELDTTRRERVFAAIRPDQQVLLTTTDPHAFDAWRPSDATWLRVSRGRLEAAMTSTRN